MAFLMLLHEKMRLQRKVSQLEAKQHKNANFLDRMTKKIEKVQKQYSKKEEQLKRQASIWEKQFTTNMQNTFGLGTMNQTWNPVGGGMTSYVYGQMAQIANSNINLGKDKDGNERNITLGSERYKEILQEFQAGSLRQFYENNKAIEGKYGKNGNITQDEFDAFNAIKQQAEMNQSYTQQFVQSQINGYQQNASIWLEAQLSQLEYEQEMELDPLKDLETEYNLEKESIEVQLQLAEDRKKTIEQKLAERVQDSTPKFGLS